MMKSKFLLKNNFMFNNYYKCTDRVVIYLKVYIKTLFNINFARSRLSLFF